MNAPTKSELAQKWPHDQPNGWDQDAARFIAHLQMYPMMWLCLSRAKYVEMRIDTRDCGFNLYDRDHNPLSPDEVIAAIEKLKATFGDDGQQATWQWRQGSRPEEPLLAEVARLRATLLNIQAKAESDFPLDSSAVAKQCAHALSHGQSENP